MRSLAVLCRVVVLSGFTLPHTKTIKGSVVQSATVERNVASTVASNLSDKGIPR
jgi:hypothetical protein